jgi:hypothetical protein
LRKISKAQTPSCGKLAALAFDKTIDTSFVVTPTVATTKPKDSTANDGQVYVLINGYYKISALGTLVATIALPQLVLSLSTPSEFTFGGIVEKIRQTILDNGVQVVEQLWNDRSQLAKFIAVFVSRKVLKQLIAEMACKDLQKELEAFEKALENGSGDGDGGGGDGGGGGGGGGGGVSPGSVGAGIGSVLSILGCGGGNGEGSGGSGAMRGAALAAPTNLGRRYVARDPSQAGQKDRVVLEWKDVAPAVGYEVQLVDSTRTVVGRVRVESAPGSHAPTSSWLAVDPPVVAPGACLLRVKALADANGGDIDSDFTTIPIVKLAAPSNLELNCDETGEVVTVKWSAIAAATEYVVLLHEVNTNIVAALTTLSSPFDAGTTLTQKFPAVQFATRSAGLYRASVKSQAGTGAIPSDTLDSTPLAMLAAPASVNQSVLGEGLQVTWTPVEGQKLYRIELTNLDTTAQAMFLATAGGNINPAGPTGLLQEHLSFDDFPVRAHGRYQVAVAVMGDTKHIASGSTSAPTFDVLFDSVPLKGLRFDGAATAITLSKCTYEQAAGYRDIAGGYEKSPNSLVDVANTGVTWQAMVYPSKSGGELPLFSYDYDGLLPNPYGGRQDPTKRQFALPGTDAAFQLSIRNGTLYFSVMSATWNAGVPSNPVLRELTTSVPVPLNRWSLVTFVWFHEHAHLFLEAQEVGELQCTTFLPANFRWNFGRCGTAFFEGAMANIALWKGGRNPGDVQATSRERLTDQEISDLQSKGLGGYWPVDEGMGYNAQDYTAVANHGNILAPHWNDS